MMPTCEDGGMQSCDGNDENTETPTLLRALMDAEIEGVVEAEDGCQVEPDGRCEHGFRSPLLIAGVL